MEIIRYMNLYKKNDPAIFYEWLSCGKIIEVRFLSDNQGTKFNNWGLIKRLSQELRIDCRFNSLFINSYDQLKFILLYRLQGLPLTKLYNIFVGVNPRRKVFIKGKNGILQKSYYGGIAGTSHIQTILCDIEHIGEREGNATEEMLEECIQGAQYLIRLLELDDYYLNISGNGVHLWFRLETPIELPIPTFTEFKDKIKYNLKEEPINTFVKTYNHFIEKMNSNIKEFNPRLKVDDGAKDISRIARPPGSWNVKSGKVARAVGTVAIGNQIFKYNNQKFMAAKPLLDTKAKKYKEIKIQSKNYRYNTLNLIECPLFKLMTSRLLPSTLSRNHYLEQSFARILRDNNIGLDEVTCIIDQMSMVQQKSVQVDPDYLDDDEPFNAETINAYCFGCHIDLVYPIMEDIPNITEGFQNEKSYEGLNTITQKSVWILSEDLSNVKINSYFELKTLIRNLIDKYPRSTVLFSLKRRLWNDWDYYNRNKIIIQIMNKTRKVIKNETK